VSHEVTWRHPHLSSHRRLFLVLVVKSWGCIWLTRKWCIMTHDKILWSCGCSCEKGKRIVDVIMFGSNPTPSVNEWVSISRRCIRCLPEAEKEQWYSSCFTVKQSLSSRWRR
jgi:hypothetical protein